MARISRAWCLERMLAMNYTSNAITFFLSALVWIPVGAALSSVGHDWIARLMGSIWNARSE